MNPYQKKCEDCKWWDGKKSWIGRMTLKRFKGMGVCKRYPKDEDKGSHNFCGEYTPVLGKE